MDQIIQREFDEYINAFYPGTLPGSNRYGSLRHVFFEGVSAALNRSIDIYDVKSMQRELSQYRTLKPVQPAQLAQVG